MPFEFLDEIATADVAFEAWGDTVEEMFISAAEATMNVMVADLEKIERSQKRQIQISSDALDMLLFNLLQEIIFFKDAEQLLLRIEKADIELKNGVYLVKATGWGEQIDPERHRLVVDVKAVTLHRFKVEQTPRGWETFIILDI
ncbi:MAG TPA: archease [Syntrophobacteraceae bacterium]|nr:archease [Syntrophobacteraceae bacterium]